MKVALITGGSRGIGRACAIELAKSGHHIIINYKSNETAAKEAVSLVVEAGSTAEILQFDVSDRVATTAAIENWCTQNEDKVITLLVNNAGIRKDNLMALMEPEEWDTVLNIHLGGFFNATHPLLKHMIRKRSGRIINIVSLSGLTGMPGQTNYSGAKAGIIGASKALAKELGRRKITVNCVAPGFIKTDMIEDLDEDQFKKMIPMKRFGKPEEVAKVVGFLASEGASYITGEVISVNGGLYT